MTRWFASAVRALPVALSLLATTTVTVAQTRADTRLNTMFTEAGRSQAMLRMLLRQLPKGADLHNHGSGGIFVEDILAMAAAKDGCLLLATMTLAAPPCIDGTSVPVRGLETRDVTLYNDAIDGMSTRGQKLNVREPTESGHERFFRSFGRFGFGTSGENARVLAISLEQAGYDNNHYLELMMGPSVTTDLNALYVKEAWNEADMQGRFDRLVPQLNAVLADASAATDRMLQGAAAINNCDSMTPGVGCDVTLRLLMTVSREASPEQVFGRMAWSFAVVNADPRFVGVNIAQPEDGPVSLRDYSLHMRMFAFFKQHYPQVKLTLHAGELALGLTPPRDLRFHIREAVEVAGALRIGHGVDIAHEDGATELLARMAREHIAVEINLTSNDVILGVLGAEHPLTLYRAAGVPVALSTDDSGVSRNDLTNEYLRAVTEHGLQYTDLRQISRDSLTYSFIEGESLWDASGMQLTDICKGLPKKPSPACTTLLTTSAKAKEQWRLEQAFAGFEAQLPKLLQAIPPAAL